MNKKKRLVSSKKQRKSRHQTRSCWSQRRRSIVYFIPMFILLSLLIVLNLLATSGFFDDMKTTNINKAASIVSLLEKEQQPQQQPKQQQQQPKQPKQEQLHKYEPLHCTPDDDKNGFRSSTTYKNWIDPNNGELITTKTKTNPSFFISLNNQQYDHMRWQIKEKGKYYETVLTDAFIEILQKQQQQQQHSNNNNNNNNNNRKVVVMDVGSNIGWFSLLSASLGQYNIYTFDASPTHLVRLCESLVLNNWTTGGMTTTEDHTNNKNNKNSSIVNLYNYGVGQYDDTKLTFATPHRNPGAGQIVLDAATASKYVLDGDIFNIDILSLDGFAIDQGWIMPNNNNNNNNNNNDVDHNNNNNNNNKQQSPPPPQPTIAILKIDVEGIEDKVIQGSQKLLQSGLVENIFMELSMSRSYESQLQLITTMVNASYHLYKTGQYKGPKNVFLVEEGNNNNKSLHIQEIMNFIAERTPGKGKRTPSALNVWWKRT